MARREDGEVKTPFGKERMWQSIRSKQKRPAEMFSTGLWYGVVLYELLHEYHLSCLRECACCDAVQVHAARQLRSIEAYFVGAGGLTSVHQRGNALAGDVVDLKLHIGGFRQCVANACARVEWVRVVRAQVERLREFACCTVDSIAVIAIRSITIDRAVS